ncbi:MAG: glycoside hydrolase family 15 protein, partial [Dehalococcoidia bacterium]
MSQQLSIRDLAVIGDRRTAAVVDRNARIVWYCPGRFDYPSLFSSLLDEQKGGDWSIHLPGAEFHSRRYLEESGALETSLQGENGLFSVTDWMPMGVGQHGICRSFSTAPATVEIRVRARPNYGSMPAQPEQLDGNDGGIDLGKGRILRGSHRLVQDASDVRMVLPEGDSGWMVLLDEPGAQIDSGVLQRWLSVTLSAWAELATHITYHGPYEREVAQSLQALRLLTHADSGGVIAAITSSLPEVTGGSRNYDYRYVWLRDAGMVLSALLRAGSDASDALAFLAFLCKSVKEDERPPLPPFLSLGRDAAPAEQHLDLEGFADSRPVRIGNGARGQWQLDGFGNILLAAKLLYGGFDTREHWSIVEHLADFVANSWKEPDNGIWEESKKEQYTIGKVVSARGLEFIAEFASDRAKAKRWRAEAARIRQFVADNCLTSEGAYAAYAGSEAVDVSAVLIPIWDYAPADSSEMRATIAVLDRDYSDGTLYWRHLVDSNSREEGAFLAGTLWVAQLSVMLGDLTRARQILDACLGYTNDLGLFAEEAEPSKGEMLGNLPQAFVHAA